LPYSIAVDPTGKFAYAPNIDASTVSAFAIDPTSGALTLLGGAPVPTGLAPLGITLSR
jgi:DNA-binding beta-propeller fold protein YncE